VLSQCIFRFEAFQNEETKNQYKPNLTDYCVYFVFLTMDALCNDNKCILNKPTMMEVYYELIDVLFKIDAPSPKEIGENN